MNEIIVKLIKEARLERGLTQHDLAKHLGRSTAAISELERGKVQVSASNLYQIAQLTNKPIEYFFGEEYGEKEIQDMIAILRKETPEARAQSIATTAMLLRIQEIGDKLKDDPEKELSIDELKDFFSSFIAFSKYLNDITAQVNDIRDKLLHELKLQGIDLSIQ
jgi:transcriptional regulator with XRE-family HTH domain